MRKNWLLGIILILTTSSTHSQTVDTTILKLFQDSYYVIKAMREDNGIYLDALKVNADADDKPAAIVANGVGLVSLCIADQMYKNTGDSINWESDAAQLVRNTLKQFLDFKAYGNTNATGFFHRYFDPAAGDTIGEWSGEYSTVDNAIFAMGVTMCKNYFQDDTLIQSYSDTLLKSMDFTAAISNNGTQMYLVVDEDGNGVDTTGAFNEYMIVAYLAINVSSTHPGYAKSITYWNTYYQDPNSANIPKPSYWGYESLSDRDSGWLSNFVPQFAYYYTDYFRSSEDYLNYYHNTRRSDSLWWTKAMPGINSHEWGLGAGENPGGGYTPVAVEYNEKRIVSPHIIGGFLPIYKNGKEDLIYLYNNVPAALYHIPSDTARKVLWRYSRLALDQRCDYIQAVDYSSMLYGLASLPEFLGIDFWDNNLKLTSSIRDEPIPKFQIFPNPSTNYITIQLAETYHKVHAIVSTLNGQELIKVDLIDQKTTLNIEQLPEGVYLLSIHDGETKRGAKKIIKK